MSSLPTGTVTFLFTDIEGSTALLQRLGDRRYAEILAEHQRLLRDAFAAGNGHEVDTQGDAFLVAFSRARDALGTAVAAQRALMEQAWPDGASLRVRMGLHTGEPVSGTEGYVGLDVHRASRICAAGHGGQILVSQAVGILASPDLPLGVSLRDLGSHRLKDLREPEYLFQVVHADLATDFPPLRSLDALPNNLPVQLTTFVGREREIAQIKDLLTKTHLLTLTGIGGAGKTRLALQVAAEVLDEFKEGVWLVELDVLSDPDFLPHAVATVLNVREQPGRPILVTLADYLQKKRLLLLLDNCEHIVTACAYLAEALLRSCPDLGILATSREALEVTGEVTWRVPSLSAPAVRDLPPLDQLLKYEAVHLFVDRACAALPGFTLSESNAQAIAQICHDLDGIPLALELAAARVKVFTVEQIGRRLDDRFRLLTRGRRTALPRHQTLRATMDWSHGLLSEPEQVFFRRLSVFVGGFTLEAAEAVCSGYGIDEVEVAEFLAQLVGKSLVTVEEQERKGRYRLLETVRQFGQEKLSEAGETAAIQAHHRDFFLAVAEEAEPHLMGRDQTIWFDRLEAEHDNLRAALERSSQERGEPEFSLSLSSTLWWFWQVHGYLTEGRKWLEGAVAASPQTSSPARAKVLYRAGFLAWLQRDLEHAVRFCEESMALCQELQDRRGLGFAHLVLGWVEDYKRNHSRAVEHLQKSLALFREAGDRWAVALALFNLADLHSKEAHLQRAAAELEESLGVFREAGDKWGIAFCLAGLGMVLKEQGDDERARHLLEESLRLRKELGNRSGIAIAQNHLGELARYRGEHETARSLHEESLSLFKELGEKSRIATTLRLLGLVAYEQDEYENAEAVFKECLRLFQELGDRGGIAEALEGFAKIRLARGQGESGVRLLAKADDLREEIGLRLSPREQKDHERLFAAARAALPHEVFASAWAEGRAMTLEQAIEYALAPGDAC